MTRTHLAWHSSGRTLVLDTGQHCYCSAMGQTNVEVRAGEFLPYTWNATTQRARFADMELRFLSDGIELWKIDAITRHAKFAAHPESWNGSSWVRTTPTLGSLIPIEITTTGSRDILQLSYTLNTPDQRAQVIVEVGGSHKVWLTSRVLAKTAGDHRLVWDVDVDEEMMPQTRIDRSGDTQIPVQYRNGKFRWTWKPRELPGRTVESNTSLFRPKILEGTYAVNEEKEARPDTLGPTDIAAEGDDGDEDQDPLRYSDIGIYATGFLYIEGESALNVNIAAFRWDNIDLNTTSPGVDSIDAGTQIELFNDDGAGGPNDNGGTPANIGIDVHAEDATDPAQWFDGGGTRPRDRTVTTGVTIATSGRGGGGSFVQSVQTAITELVITDGNAYEGATAMAFQFRQTTGGDQDDYWSLAEDYDGAGANEETALTIVFTPTSEMPVGSLSLLGVGV